MEIHNGEYGDQSPSRTVCPIPFCVRGVDLVDKWPLLMGCVNILLALFQMRRCPCPLSNHSNAETWAPLSTHLDSRLPVLSLGTQEKFEWQRRLIMVFVL